MSDFLPQEIIRKICFSLPTETVGKCRCVCLSWNIMLSDPNFIEAHSKINYPHYLNNVILISSANTSHLFSITLPADAGVLAAPVAKTINLVQFRQVLWENIVGSCRGLILMLGEEQQRLDCKKHDKQVIVYEKYLTNPTTLKIVKVPTNPFTLDMKKTTVNGFDYLNLHGFGYDCTSDDFKIVTLYSISNYRIHPSPSNKNNWAIDVFSLNSGIWRRLSISLDDDYWPPYVTNGPYTVVAAFRLNQENFEYFKAPTGIVIDYRTSTQLVNLGEKLGIVVNDFSDDYILWTMESYGAGKSWTKVLVSRATKRFASSFEPICLLSEDEILVSLGFRRKKLAVYNLKDKIWRDVLVTEMPHLHTVMAFEKTLISPNFPRDQNLGQD
ncbi:hypothetical protein ACH5RR_031114 [Cinchona calisaya]|uniref:F-box domain-containing protein n=1 Tax=Cinchona calisaya TaxID=153742 RepID=A0ABD2YH99_9GENT